MLFKRFSLSDKEFDILTVVLRQKGVEVYPNPEFQRLLREKLVTIVQSQRHEDALFGDSRYAGLIAKIKLLVQEVHPALFFRVKLREHLVTAAEILKPRRMYFISDLWQRVFTPKTWAGIVLSVLIVFLILPFIQFNSSDRIDLFVNEGGSVIVMRGEQHFSIPVNSSIVLYEGDKIVTDSRTVATVNYFDDVVTRIGGNSQIVIERVYSVTDEGQWGVVQIELKKGKMWSNMVGFGSVIGGYTVISDSIIIRPSSRAVFDLELTSDGLFTAVSENVLDVAVASQHIDQPIHKTVVEGYGLMISSKQNAEPFQLRRDKEYVSGWFAENRLKDEALVAQLSQKRLAQTKAKAGILPHDPFYVFAKSFPEQTKLALTFNQIEKEKLILEFAKQRLIEAQALILEGKEQEGIEALEEFQRLSERVINTLHSLEAEGTEGVQGLRRDVEHEFSTARHQIVPIDPFDGLYQIKSWIQKVQVKIPNPNDVVSEQLVRSQQMSELLVDAQDLIRQKNFSAVSEVFNTYKNYASVLTDRLAFKMEFGGHLLLQRVHDLSYLLVIQSDLEKEDVLVDEVQELGLIVMEQIRSILDTMMLDQGGVLTAQAAAARIKRLTVHEVNLELLDELKSLIKEVQ